MHAAAFRQEVRAGWVPRAIVSGFSASAVMLFGYMIAYGLATLLASVPLTAEKRGADMMRTWLYALTHNPVIDWGVASLYVAVAAYFVGGLLWALVYARLAEPYLRGPGWWRGVVFSLIPAAVSLVVVLPLLGGGLAGMGLGAGPLPLLGNLLLHALYGATLGLIYGPFGDLSAETFQPDTPEEFAAMAHAERTAARAALVGGVIGVAIGLLPALATGLDQQATVLGVSPVAFMLATVLSGVTLGALVGSLVGLPSMDHEVA
jgi:hypothetical protein